MLSGRMSGRSGPGRRVSATSGLSLVNTDLNCSLRMRALEGASSSSSYNFSDALHMRSIMHCCWWGVRGCLNNFSGCYCKIEKLR